MMILALTLENNKIHCYLKNKNIPHIVYFEKIDRNFIEKHKITFIISYRYRYIIRKDIIDLGLPMINLHISMLPWNRGTFPNLWSFVENTPKGITIHYIDEGLDTGDIIYQKEYIFDDKQTLKETYDILNNDIQNMFIDNFDDIVSGKCPKIKQTENCGSLHLSKQKDLIWNVIEKHGGWDITADMLMKLCLRNEFC